MVVQRIAARMGLVPECSPIKAPIRSRTGSASQSTGSRVSITRALHRVASRLYDGISHGCGPEKEKAEPCAPSFSSLQY
jgi:hypothetical protein